MWVQIDNQYGPKPLSCQKSFEFPAPKSSNPFYRLSCFSSFDPFQKKRVGSREKLEMGKLMHKMKRERKGAKKDIRADAAFIANQKAKERKEK